MPESKKMQDVFTPQELSEFNDKTTSASELERFHIRTDSAEIVAYKKRRNLLAAGLGIGIFLLIILFIISLLVTHWGDLIIEIDSYAITKGLALSEDPGFGSHYTTLSAKQANSVTNITKSWLPHNLDTSGDGEHNGDNYVAYTFYVKNVGEYTLDYDASLEIIGAAKSADEAVRVMVYKNGQPRVYGKSKYNNREMSEEDCYKFVYSAEDGDGSIVMTSRTENFEVDQIDKYTIVIWIEGNDPECIDDIRNGHVRMRMLFEIEGEDSPHSIFGTAYEEYIASISSQENIDEFGFVEDNSSIQQEDDADNTSGTASQDSAVSTQSASSDNSEHS